MIGVWPSYLAAARTTEVITILAPSSRKYSVLRVGLSGVSGPREEKRKQREEIKPSETGDSVVPLRHLWIVRVESRGVSRGEGDDPIIRNSGDSGVNVGNATPKGI